MELSEPAIVMRNGELIAARTGKAGAVDPFFTNVKSELSDKGSSSPQPTISLSRRGRARSCGCSSGLPAVRSR